MPTYEYRCKACSNEFEAVQSFTDDALTECPACGGPLRKLFGSVGISFKGSGFYKNDHGSRASGATAPSSSSADSSASTSTSSDSSSTKSESSSSGDSASKSTKSESAA
jgi:putative FmdB family regulatory protein